MQEVLGKNKLQSLNELFESLQVKDVVWCLMPLPKAELDKMDVNHQIRPYVVVKKKNNGFLGYASSSKLKENNDITRHRISKVVDGKQEDSYFLLDKLCWIPKENLRDPFYTLKNKEFQGIKKRASIINKEEYLKVLDVGDVVFQDGKLYYVYKVEQNKAFGVLVTRIKPEAFNKEANTIQINNKFYKLDFKINVLKRRTMSMLNNVATEEQIFAINSLLYKNHIEKATRDYKALNICGSNILMVGDILLDGEDNYYIYAVDNSSAYGFNVSEVSVDSKELKVKVGEKLYTLDLNNFKKFKRETSLKISNIADKDNVLQIESLRKVNKTIKKEELKALRNELVEAKETLKMGMVFHSEGDKLVYLFTEGNKHYCANLLFYKIKKRLISLTTIPLTEDFIDEEMCRNILSYCAENETQKTRCLKLCSELKTGATYR